MTTNFYLRDSKAKSKTAIFVQINYNGRKLKFFPGESILPEFWNHTTQRAESLTVLKQEEKRKRNKFNEQMEFNERLNRIQNTITSIYLDYKNKHDHEIPSPSTLKALFDTAMKRGGGRITLMEYYKEFIERSENGLRLNPKSKKAVNPSAAKSYRTTYNYLLLFNKSWIKKVDFDTIDLEFHADFTNFLFAKPRLLSSNTCGTQIKNVKAVMAEATEKGVNTNMVFKSTHFIKQNEESENIYLNESELKEMEGLDLLNNPRLDKVRDLFLIGANTGLRYSDFSRLEPDNISDGMITIVQVKTSRPVVIPVHPVVKSILEKYNGIPPKSISNTKLNKYLKEIGEKMECLKKMESKTITKGGLKVTNSEPKWKYLSSHTCRRSFLTNEYKNGVDTITLMAISGHKTQQSFLKYIKVTPLEHAQKLQAIWLKRNTLRVA